jgi:hypothetical protein
MSHEALSMLSNPIYTSNTNKQNKYKVQKIKFPIKFNKPKHQSLASMFSNSKINKLSRLPFCTIDSNVDEKQQHFIKHMVCIYKIEIEQNKIEIVEEILSKQKRNKDFVNKNETTNNSNNKLHFLQK